MRRRPAVLVAALLTLTACTSDRVDPAQAGRTTAGGTAAPPTAVPTLENLPADFVEFAPSRTLGDSGLRGRRFGPSATLEGPHFGYRFAGVATTRTLPPQLAELLSLPASVAAPGHEFVLAEVSSTGHDGPDAGDTQTSADSTTVAVGPARHEISVLITGIVIASVPTGKHPWLEVTDAGRKQSFDLRAGSRGRDAVNYTTRTAEYEHTPEDQEWIRLRLAGPGVAGIPSLVRYAGAYMPDLDVRLVPWRKGQGWAPRGRSWLVVQPSVWVVPVEGSPLKGLTANVGAGAFRVSGPDGARYPVSGRPFETTFYPPGSGTFVAAVPTALKSVTVRFAMSGSMKSPTGTVSFSHYSGSQEVRLPLK